MKKKALSKFTIFRPPLEGDLIIQIFFSNYEKDWKLDFLQDNL